jgi:hypothetical protein
MARNRKVTLPEIMEAAKAAPGTAAAIGILLVFLAALRMLRTVQSDLALYQETGRLNEEMLNMTVGINALVSKVISSNRGERPRAANTC